MVSQGTASVLLDSDEFTLREGESIDIKQGQIHKLTNIGKVPLVVVEVQQGSYIGEDDVVRLNV